MRRFRRVLLYFLRYRRELAIGAGALFVASLLDIGIPLIVARAINRLVKGIREGGDAPGEPLGRFLLLSLALLVGLTAVKGFFRFWQRRLLVGVSRKVESDLKKDFFAHLTTLSLPFFARSRTGDLLSRATADVEAVRLFLGPGSMYAASTLLLVPVALAAMLVFHPLLTALVAVPLAALAWSMKRITPELNRHSEAVQARLSEMSERAQENFAGVRVVKGFHREAWEIERFGAVADAYRAHQLDLGRARALNHMVLHAARDAAVLLILVVGGLGVARGTFTLGGMYLFLDYVNRLFWPLIALGWMAGMYHRAAAGMDRIEEVFRTAPEIGEPKSPARVEAIAGAIEFRGLTFAYDGEPVLRGVSLLVKPGETVGIVGRIGSGKTTLVSLLGRLFPVPDGSIFVDGEDVNRIPLRRLREAIGYVPQDAFLFSDTIRENIAFGFDDPPDPAAVARAAEQAGLGPDLPAFPSGLDTLIGERGVTLSGGQRSRVSIARATLRRPKILVLDDVLSAVDTETEVVILENLRGSARGSTVLLVAQRLSAVEGADRIVVLDRGSIVEEGTHAQLLSRGGWYARTVRRQRLEGELERI